jgi:multiple antibiotic resistance protein
MLIAFAFLIGFLFSGPFILSTLHISQSALHIAGGIILFLIAIKMVFGGADQLLKESPDGEPFIVPLAVPLIAGPSAIATLLLLVGQAPGRWPAWLLAVCIAWFGTAVILISSSKLASLLGKRGLCAIERLMGLLLTAVSVEMFLGGIRFLLEG